MGSERGEGTASGRMLRNPRNDVNEVRVASAMYHIPTMQKLARGIRH